MKPVTYEVKYNYCDCHPETCCCNAWVVKSSKGTRHGTFYKREDADNCAAGLNAVEENKQLKKQLDKMQGKR